MASTIYDDNIPPDATACLDDDQSVLSDPPESDDDDGIPVEQKESEYEEAPKKKRLKIGQPKKATATPAMSVPGGRYTSNERYTIDPSAPTKVFLSSTEFKVSWKIDVCDSLLVYSNMKPSNIVHLAKRPISNRR